MKKFDEKVSYWFHLQAYPWGHAGAYDMNMLNILGDMPNVNNMKLQIEKLLLTGNYTVEEVYKKVAPQFPELNTLLKEVLGLDEIKTEAAAKEKAPYDPVSAPKPPVVSGTNNEGSGDGNQTGMFRPLTSPTVYAKSWTQAVREGLGDDDVRAVLELFYDVGDATKYLQWAKDNPGKSVEIKGSEAKGTLDYRYTYSTEHKLWSDNFPIGQPERTKLPRKTHESKGETSGPKGEGRLKFGLSNLGLPDDTCRDCGGSGQYTAVDTERDCPTCGGYGSKKNAKAHGAWKTGKTEATIQSSGRINYFQVEVMADSEQDAAAFKKLKAKYRASDAENFDFAGVSVQASGGMIEFSLLGVEGIENVGQAEAHVRKLLADAGANVEEKMVVARKAKIEGEMCTVTQKEWRKRHRESKCYIKGQPYMLKYDSIAGGTRLVPVQIVKNLKVEDDAEEVIVFAPSKETTVEYFITVQGEDEAEWKAMEKMISDEKRGKLREIVSGMYIDHDKEGLESVVFAVLGNWWSKSQAKEKVIGILKAYGIDGKSESLKIREKVLREDMTADEKALMGVLETGEGQPVSVQPGTDLNNIVNDLGIGWSRQKVQETLKSLLKKGYVSGDPLRFVKVSSDYQGVYPMAGIDRDKSSTMPGTQSSNKAYVGIHV